MKGMRSGNRNQNKQLDDMERMDKMPMMEDEKPVDHEAEYRKMMKDMHKGMVKKGGM